jgi:hypothetical protein
VTGASTPGAGRVAVAPVEAAVTAGVTTSPVRERVEIPVGAQLGLFITAGFTIVLGIWPGPLFAFVHAAKLLF